MAFVVDLGFSRPVGMMAVGDAVVVTFEDEPPMMLRGGRLLPLIGR